MPGLYGTVQLGRMSLLDADFSAALSPDKSMKVTVQAASSMMSNAAVERRGHDMLGLRDQLVPVVFSDKTSLTGMCRVTDIDLTHWSYPGNVGRRVVVATATLTMQRIGGANAVEIESRLAGAQTRSNDHNVVGTRWHAPAGGHAGYWAGAAVRPSVRHGADGPLVVYRNIPDRTYPRWTSIPEAFGNGRVRFLDAAGEERTGIDLPLPLSAPTGGLFPADTLYPAEGLFPAAPTFDVPAWTLSNELIRITPVTTGGLFSIATYSGGAWQAGKVWDIRTADGSIGPISGINLLHNTYDTVVLRLFVDTWPGSIVVDLVVRRGAPFVEVRVETPTAGTITIRRGTAEAGASGTGHVAAAANDAGGNRYVIGSTRSFTADLTRGGISKAGVAALDAFIGTVLGGASAARGDTAAELLSQYLGSPAETMTAIRR